MLAKRILIPLGVVALLVSGYRNWGWAGLVLTLGCVLFWLLLHYTRVMHILKRAALSPIGYVDSAVMLQAKLKPKMALMDVIALTRSLGEQLSAPQAQPEQFRWSDPSEASVSCDFQDDKVVRWVFRRPSEDAASSSRPLEPSPAP